jgi:hypothetical protein
VVDLPVPLVDDDDLLCGRDFAAAAFVDFEPDALLATDARRDGARTTSSWPG